MAYLRRRVLADGTPRFQVRGSTYETGKRHYFSKEFGSEREAIAYLHGAAAKRERRGVVGGQSTLASYVRDIWLPHLEAAGELGKKTVAEYRTQVERALRLIGHLRLDRLTPRALDQCYVKLLQGGGKNGRPLHARTVLHSHRVLHTSLEQAVRWDLLSDNPARRARPPRVGKSRATAPTPQQLERYLAVARTSPYWAVVLTALATGLRRSELLALRWADVDLEQATLTVTQTVWEAKGEYGIRSHKAKTEESLRTIAIPPVLVTELRQLKLRQTELRLQVGPEYRADLDLIFARAGGELWTPSELGRRIKQLHTRAGLPPEVRPLHGLRHAFATESLAAGVGLKTVAERMGHTGIAITANLYGHVHREVDRRAALALDDVLRPLIKNAG